MKMRIVHLYPSLLNLYGDRGNILALKRRLEWRGIKTEVVAVERNEDLNFASADIIFLGGGSDREQLIVCERLRDIKDGWRRYVECGGVAVAVCGGYQLLGQYYKMGDRTIEGVGVVDIFTETGEGRIIGNMVIKSDFLDKPIVGFENHGGRTHIGKYTPLGKVLCGGGNNGSDGGEGIIYKNVFGTYMHGPVFPKNPHFCDYVLQRAIERKDEELILAPLNDSVEMAANEYIVERFTKTIA